MWRLFLTDQKIGVRLFVSISIPMIILLGFAGQSLYSTYSASSSMARVDRLASFSPALTNLVHELQKERGTSAGFIGSKADRQFASKLARQRTLSDDHLSRFHQAISRFDQNAYGAKFSALLSSARKAVADLKTTRSQVDNLTLSVGEMAKYYTGTISRLFKTVSYMALLSPDSHLSNQITAYTSFLQAKERAGQERAMGTTGFSSGRFPPKIHKQFSALIAQQNSFLGLFINTATPEQASRYKNTMSAKIVSKVEQMRFVGVRSAYSPSREKLSISGPEWFDAITQKINLMKNIEDGLSSDIVSYTRERSNSLQRWFYTIAATTLGIFALTILFVIKVSHSIIDPIGKITAYMNKMASGELSAHLDLEDRRDQIGDMMKSIEVFRRQNLQKQQMERENKKQTEKFESDKAAHSIKQLAQSMEELNGIAINLGMLDNHSQEVSSSSQTIASAAEQLVSSVGEISINSEGASSDALETEQTVSKGLHAAQDAMGAIQIIWDTMEDSVQSLDELTNASVQIEQILNVIEDIAEQTNLLALNATIEAARAGEAGKGFAVVASEVKNLANQSSKATEDIAQRIQALKEGMENISSTMEISREAVSTGRGSIEQTAQTMDLAAQQVSSVSTKMSDITDILHQQKGSSSEIARSISEVADFAQESQKQLELVVERVTSTNDMMTGNAQQWFEANSSRSLCEIAKIDHIQFQKMVIDVVMGRTSLSADKIISHHNCRLGKWYDALNLPEIIDALAFKELAAPHKQVHESAKKAIEAYQHGQISQAFEAISEMKKSGLQVIALLDQLSELLAKKEQAA